MLYFVDLLGPPVLSLNSSVAGAETSPAAIGSYSRVNTTEACHNKIVIIKGWEKNMDLSFVEVQDYLNMTQRLLRLQTRDELGQCWKHQMLLSFSVQTAGLVPGRRRPLSVRAKESKF